MMSALKVKMAHCELMKKKKRQYIFLQVIRDKNTAMTVSSWWDLNRRDLTRITF